MVKSKKVKRRKKRKEFDPLWLVFLVAVLIVIISVFYQEDGLSKEANFILDEFSNGNKYSFVVGNTIHEEKLEEIVEMDYKELKENLNVENDFCVYFEDEDGNLVEIKGVKAIGSEIIEINGVPCGQ